MSATKIKTTGWLCVCELPGCPGGGKSWTSLGDKPPDRCRFCKRWTWNRPDRRVKKKMTERQLRAYNRKKQAESRARRKEKINFKRERKTMPIVHWIINSQIFCRSAGNLSSTTEKEKVNCQRCKKLMRLHGHLPESE